MQDDIDQVLIDRKAIESRVAQLAGQITADALAEARFVGDTRPLELTLIPILTGSFIFAADLIRRLPVMLQIRLLSISSYPGAATTSRGARIEHELTNLPPTLEGAHLLLLDDILDSGNTLRLAVDTLKERGPASIKTCVLLRKQRPQAMAFPVDYVAFDIPDRFVVGYGLDFNDYYRNLPDIVTLRPHVVEQMDQRAQT